MASVNDWAAAAARRIKGEKDVERIAAIIETFAKPLLDLLRELRPCHDVNCEYDSDEDDSPCTCGAVSLNARINAALAAPDPERARSTRPDHRPRSG